MSTNTFETKGKKLLVLGGTSGKDIVAQAKRMGVYTIVADLEEMNAAKSIADEGIVVSTTDTEALVKLIREKSIDGVFSGPSEFNIQQVMKVCEAAGLPFYATKEQWDICQNKAAFKALCRRFNVPVVPEYDVTAEMLPEDLVKIKYPVVVKPTDACSSKGLSICVNEEELRKAIPVAIAASESGNFIVEKCITSDYGFGCRYIANEGKIVLSAANDQYTVDEFDGRAHISAVSCWPSKKLESYKKEINPNAISMFESIGLANGTFFMQALVDQDNGHIYFHEMGLRLSGGLNYKMFESGSVHSESRRQHHRGSCQRRTAAFWGHGDQYHRHASRRKAVRDPDDPGGAASQRGYGTLFPRGSRQSRSELRQIFRAGQGRDGGGRKLYEP